MTVNKSLNIKCRSNNNNSNSSNNKSKRKKKYRKFRRNRVKYDNQDGVDNPAAIAAAQHNCDYNSRDNCSHNNPHLSQTTHGHICSVHANPLYNSSILLASSSTRELRQSHLSRGTTCSNLPQSSPRKQQKQRQRQQQQHPSYYTPNHIAPVSRCIIPSDISPLQPRAIAPHHHHQYRSPPCNKKQPYGNKRSESSFSSASGISLPTKSAIAIAIATTTALASCSVPSGQTTAPLPTTTSCITATGSIYPPASHSSQLSTTSHHQKQQHATNCSASSPLSLSASLTFSKISSSNASHCLLCSSKGVCNCHQPLSPRQRFHRATRPFTSYIASTIISPILNRHFTSPDPAPPSLIHACFSSSSSSEPSHKIPESSSGSQKKISLSILNTKTSSCDNNNNINTNNNTPGQLSLDAPSPSLESLLDRKSYQRNSVALSCGSRKLSTLKPAVSVSLPRSSAAITGTNIEMRNRNASESFIQRDPSRNTRISTKNRTDITVPSLGNTRNALGAIGNTAAHLPTTKIETSQKASTSTQTSAAIEPRMKSIVSTTFTNRTPLPEDHPVIISAAKRGSIFYRRPKQPPPPPEPETVSEKAKCENDDACSIHSDCSCYEVDDEDYCDCSDIYCDKKRLSQQTGSDNYDGDFENSDTEDDSDYFSSVGYCKLLPYWNCVYVKDMDEFMYTHMPHDVRKPNEEPAQPTEFCTESKFYPWTPALVDSIIEDLHLVYMITQCHADIPFERRLPDLHTFIWDLVDGLETDLWTGIATIILLRRFQRSHGFRIRGLYDAAHKLILGIFMTAASVCVKTNTPEKYHHTNIIKILNLPYVPKDMVEIKRSVVEGLKYNIWISEADISDFASKNLFDIRLMHQAYPCFLARQERRRLFAEQERKREQESERLKKSLEKYMFRTPHDSIGSWNMETMYCTESKFFYRHLPWCPGMSTPIYITMESSTVHRYLNKNSNTKPPPRRPAGMSHSARRHASNARNAKVAAAKAANAGTQNPHPAAVAN